MQDGSARRPWVILGMSLLLWVGVGAVDVRSADGGPDAKADVVPIFRSFDDAGGYGFIHKDDETTFACMDFVRRQTVQMPDKRRIGTKLFPDDSFIFDAHYGDGSTIEMRAHPDFGSEHGAEDVLEPLALRLGQFPTLMRMRLDHVVVHTGREAAYADPAGNFLVVYADDIRERARGRDLEEVLFRETVRATLEAREARSGDWLRAQRADGTFVTDYAASGAGEDFAESALFSWAMLIHPGRLPGHLEAYVRDRVPNRLSYFKSLFVDQPAFYSIGLEPSCD